MPDCDTKLLPVNRKAETVDIPVVDPTIAIPHTVPYNTSKSITSIDGVWASMWLRPGGICNRNSDADC